MSDPHTGAEARDGAQASGQAGEQPEITGFRLVLNNFEGPFDLLLNLISSKKLDVTEVALAEVTDEFIAYTRALGETADLDEICLLYTSPSPRDRQKSRMPSSA